MDIISYSHADEAHKKIDSLAASARVVTPIISAGSQIAEGGTLDLTIDNYSTQLAYYISTVGCDVTRVGNTLTVSNVAGASCSFTVYAKEDDWLGGDSLPVTRVITSVLTTPSLSSPADDYTINNITYTVSGISSGAQKVVLDIQDSSFEYVSVSSGSGVKVGNTVEVTGYTGSSIDIVIKYPVPNTYNVRAFTQATGYINSAYSTVDTIVIIKPTLATVLTDSPADEDVLTNVTYTMTVDDASDKLVFDLQAASGWTYVGQTGGTAGTTVGNTVEVTGITGTTVTVTVVFDIAATYNIRAMSIDTTAIYLDSAWSITDQIIISKITLATPTMDSPADAETIDQVTYTITVDDNSDKLVFDPQNENFLFISQTGGTSGSKVGTVVEVVGIAGTTVTVTLIYTGQAVYNNRSMSINTNADYLDSAWSIVDSISITSPVLNTPVLNSPADNYTYTDITYSVTVDVNSDKLIFDPQSADFTYVGQTGGTAGAKVGNTIEVTGIGAATVVTVTLQYTAQATYVNRAMSQDTDVGTYLDSAWSATDSIAIISPTLTAPVLDSPADSDNATNVTYTVTVDANSDKLVFDPQSADFNYVSQTGGTSGSKVGNTIEILGVSGTTVTVTLLYTISATYVNRAKSIDTGAIYLDSAYSATDSIFIDSSFTADDAIVDTMTTDIINDGF